MTKMETNKILLDFSQVDVIKFPGENMNMLNASID